MHIRPNRDLITSVDNAKLDYNLPNIAIKIKTHACILENYYSLQN